MRELFATKKKPIDVKQFFWDHIKKDIRLIAEALKITQDEVLLLLHRACFDILQFNSWDDNAPRLGAREKSYGVWLSKSDRQDWEYNFYRNFLVSLFNRMPEVFAQANYQIKKSSLGQEKTKSKFYMMAWELIDMDPKKDQYLYENEKFWKFRPSITFDTLRNALKSAEQSQYLTLRNFTELVSS